MNLSIENKVVINVTYNILYVLLIITMSGPIIWSQLADERYQKSKNKFYQLSPIESEQKHNVVHNLDNEHNEIYNKTMADKKKLAELNLPSNLHLTLTKNDKSKSKLQITHIIDSTKMKSENMDIDLDTLIEPDKIAPEKPKITPEHSIFIKNRNTGSVEQHTFNTNE